MMLRRLLLAGATASAAALGAAAIAPPAGAVQTDTYSLDAAPLPNGTPRAVLSGAGTSAAVDSAVVTDRRPAPVTLDLFVTSARPEGRQFHLGGPLTGLAAKVHLGVSRVTLQPGQTVRIPVTIGAQPGPTTYAAVLAKPEASVSAGSLDVTEQLALLVESQGGAQVAVAGAPAAHHSGMSALWPAVAGGLLALVGAGLVAEQMGSRRRGASRRAEVVFT